MLLLLKLRLGVPTFHKQLKKEKEEKRCGIFGGRHLGILKGWSHQDPTENREKESEEIKIQPRLEWKQNCLKPLCVVNPCIAPARKAERNRLSSAFYASAVQKETTTKKLLPVKGSCCSTSSPPLPPAWAGERLRREQREEEKKEGGRGLCKSARASGTEVSRAELCLGPHSICGRRSLWQRTQSAGGGGRSFPSSLAVSLAQQVAASLIPGEDPAARAIISSRQAAPRRKFSLRSLERQGRGNCHSAALEKTEG